jgi:hypothetical protein
MKKLLIIALAILPLLACRPANQTQTISDRQRTPEQISHEEELRRRQAKEWNRVNEGTKEASHKSAITPTPNHEPQIPNIERKTQNPEPKSERSRS